jgi:xanthine dehydrogenase accessory factor
MNKEVAGAALALLEKGQDFALVTIVDAQGSSPRHVGASMLVKADASIDGTIGGGALEAAAIKNGLKVLKTNKRCLMDFELTNADSAGLGMICGGHGTALIEYNNPAKPALQELYRGLSDLLSSGRKGWLVTVVSEGTEEEPAAAKCLVDSNGSVIGDLVCPPEILQDLTRRGGTSDRIVAGDPSRTYVEPIGAQGTAYVFGAGHCGEKLVRVLNMVGFFTVVVDDRADFANEERFPTADRILVPASFDVAFDGLSVDEDSYIVILTRGHLHDKNVLRQALRTPAGYIGMIGSKKKVADTFRALREEDVSHDDISRAHAPIGLPIGAETPEEIAVSIAAQLIQVRAGRRR